MLAQKFRETGVDVDYSLRVLRFRLQLLALEDAAPNVNHAFPQVEVFDVQTSSLADSHPSSS